MNKFWNIQSLKPIQPIIICMQYGFMYRWSIYFKFIWSFNAEQCTISLVMREKDANDRNRFSVISCRCIHKGSMSRILSKAKFQRFVYQKCVSTEIWNMTYIITLSSLSHHRCFVVVIVWYDTKFKFLAPMTILDP